MLGVDACKVLEFPRFLDNRGNLSFVQNFNHVPFEIKRIYWIYDVPGGEGRDGHAYKNNQEVMIALSGSIDVIVDDGQEKKKFTLSRSSQGLFIPSGLWRTMCNFSTNAFVLVIASTKYDSGDYIRDYNVFKCLTSYDRE